MELKDVNLYWVRPGELAAYRGCCLLVTDEGDSINEGVEGFWVHNTRFISRLLLKVDGKSPKLVSANPVQPHMLISYYTAPSPAGGDAAPTPEGEAPGGELGRIGIELQIADFVGGGLHRDVHVTNHGMAPISIEVGLEVDADFADFSEAQKGERQQNAQVGRRWISHDDGGSLSLSYCHPKLAHATEIRLFGCQAMAKGSSIVCCLDLLPQQTRTLALDIAPVFLGKKWELVYGVDGEVVNQGSIEEARRAWVDNCAHIEVADSAVQQAWDRAVSDLWSLQLLDGSGSELFTPAAGIPNYVGLFGRDVLMTAVQSALANPDNQAGSVSLTGRWIADDYDPQRDAQPGRTLHQRQLGPLAVLEKTPFLRFYGDHSASALFLLAIASDLAHTGNVEFFRSQRDKVLATLAWMDRDGDCDGDGFYEYHTVSGVLKNQGWKDSSQAILYKDGRLVEDPIATSEIQGAFYAAKQAIGLAFVAIGEHERCNELLAQAAALKRRFNEQFWMPDAGFFALALDPKKRQVTSIADNVGACLAYGIVDDDKAAITARRLMADDMFSGWGIRTLSNEHPAFHPFAYHLGTVWPFSNALAAFGFARYGCTEELHRLAKGIFDASSLFHLNRLPEAFGGHRRDRRHPHPGIYPNACVPQAWSASAVILLIRAMLGITPLAPFDSLIVDPHLPEWLPELELSNFRVGRTKLGLHFRREPNGSTACEVVHHTESIRLLRVPDHTVGDRLSMAFRQALEARGV
jgi:glycogen debranching enzyme